MTDEKKAKGKTALAKDFELNDDMRSWAKIHAAHIDAHGTTQEFIDYAKARDWRMVDWIATWRNWMRKAAKESQGKSRFAGATRKADAKPAWQPPEIYPQQCRWHAASNRILFEVLQNVRGVSDERLALLVRDKGVMSRRLRALYGDSDVPPENWRIISKEGYDWLLRKATAT